MNTGAFQPAVQAWFNASFAAPTPCQVRAWEALRGGHHTLVAAPTGAGKTLAAFLAAIDDLVAQSGAAPLADGVQVLYVSPLKALGNDIEKNLQTPLTGIEACLSARGAPAHAIRVAVRSGDTSARARALMRRRPPHILVTTPESLYILLTSASGREMLHRVRTVIVDEIHALAGSKRGAHLSLSLERLAALTLQEPIRIGLSATQRPIDKIAAFLLGGAGSVADCAIVDEGHRRAQRLAIELPSAPLEAVLPTESAQEIYTRMATLIAAHRTTLVFVNTRRMAERVARALSERLGEDVVTSHHGSMSKERRLDAEQRLKSGTLKALVATASLELGIDIGEVDLVCQLGSTRTLATFLQRVGRSGHAVGAVAAGHLFPQTRDELVECAALLAMAQRGELDAIEIADADLDVLAQQIVAEVAAQEWSSDALFACFRRAYCYRDLARKDFDAVVTMLARGYSFAQGRRAAYVHHDAVNHVLRGRRGARLTAMTCGGAIPDTADYDVIAEPGNLFVGTVNEDFAIESLPGSVFQLGNTTWRVLRVEASAVRVADANGETPNMPFWLGEAPARSMELSQAVARLRSEFVTRTETQDAPRAAIVSWLMRATTCSGEVAAQIYDYFMSGMRALGTIPTQDTLVMERFFDESGGMQLVIHSPFGARLNRAWGLALRKRFCRTFNFELQAAAVEDAIVISLGAVHSFPLEDVWRFLSPETVEDVLTQALLDAPMFAIRWRWVATCALAIQRFRAGKKVVPRLLRTQADDLAGVVFPDQLACLENIRGQREIPDHPLVSQTINDCLYEAMDLNGLRHLLRAIAAGEKTLYARDLTAPSPFAQAVLNANPYAFLDDAPLEERRTHAVQARRWLDPTTASDLGTLDPAAIERVREETAPVPRSADELHDALLILGAVPAGARGASVLQRADISPSSLAANAAYGQEWYGALRAQGRVQFIAHPAERAGFWLATERHEELGGLWSASHESPPEAAVNALVRGYLEVLGPVSASALATLLALPVAALEQALVALETAGVCLRGRFTAGTTVMEWCDRGLLARIHRYTLKRLRAEIEPVSGVDFVRFLHDWHGLTGANRGVGVEATHAALVQLAGYEIAASAWESYVLPGRVRDFAPAHLDQLIATGRMLWARLSLPSARRTRAHAPIGTTPIAILPRNEIGLWRTPRAWDNDGEPQGVAGRVHVYLHSNGAAFFDDLISALDIPRALGEAALAELVGLGLVTADSFIGLRALIKPTRERRHAPGRRRSPATAANVIENAGRWELLNGIITRQRGLPADSSVGDAERDAEAIARRLLGRYGVVCKTLLAREAYLSSWREILWALRRLEASGAIRGGRFIAGVSGEQFATPEALEPLRRVRRRERDQDIVVISACDPLNLEGLLVPGARVPATPRNQIAYVDGELIATLINGEVDFAQPVPTDLGLRVRTRLIGRGTTRRAMRSRFARAYR